MFQEPVSALSGYRAATKIGAQSAEISAVFCLSDITAIGLIKGLNDLGLQVPKDMSVMGFDNSQQASYTIPALTTVHQNTVMKGKNVVMQLISQMNEQPVEERSIVIGVELVLRQSTGMR